MDSSSITEARALIEDFLKEADPNAVIIGSGIALATIVGGLVSTCWTRDTPKNQPARERKKSAAAKTKNTKAKASKAKEKKVEKVNVPQKKQPVVESESSDSSDSDSDEPVPVKKEIKAPTPEKKKRVRKPKKKKTETAKEQDVKSSDTAPAVAVKGAAKTADDEDWTVVTRKRSSPKTAKAPEADSGAASS